jgi:cbb3-type cytochrome oxidase maturation protein
MLILAWIMYTGVGILVFSLAFLWAVRARQFWDQDRARYLPLEDEEPAPEEPAPDPAEKRGGSAGLLAPIIVFVIGLGLVILTVVLSYMHTPRGGAP